MSSRAFAWSTLRTVVGGKSAIDVPRLHIVDTAGATDFLACYGFTWSNPRHRAELEGIRQEAIELIEEELLPDPWTGESSLAMLPAVRDETDIRALLLMAAKPIVADDMSQKWACALLRAMHTLAHTQLYFNDEYGIEIREQILSRILPHLHGSKESGSLTLGEGDEAIPLHDLEIKHTKPRRSVALKLLHKVENVATDIFDRIGVRFITRERYDALLVVDYLRRNHIIMFANIKPSRSRNTLIDLDWLRLEMAKLDSVMDRGEITSTERTEILRERVREALPPPPEPVLGNEFSSRNYRALQFTCRQQIRIRDPHRQEFFGLADEASRKLGAGDPLTRELTRRAVAHEEVRFFFPFEIQIMDANSFSESRSGRASYREYKARQLESARRRVLGGLITD